MALLQMRVGGGFRAQNLGQVQDMRPMFAGYIFVVGEVFLAYECRSSLFSIFGPTFTLHGKNTAQNRFEGCQLLIPRRMLLHPPVLVTFFRTGFWRRI